MPSSALAAVETLYPPFARMSVRCWRSGGELSTTRTFLIGLALGLCALRLGVFLHRIEQRFLGEGLGQVLVGTGEPAARAIEDAVLAREHDHRGRFENRVLLDQSAGLVTVEPRHHDVDEDDLRLVIADFRERVEAVFGEDPLIAGLAQKHFRASTNRVAVVDAEALAPARRFAH